MQIAKIHIAFKISIAIVALGLLSLLFLFNPDNVKLFPKCPFHVVTGLHCPGCGSQRAIHSFLHGHIMEGFKHNFLITLLILVLMYDGIIYLLNKHFQQNLYNLLHHPHTTRIILILILTFWVCRNLPFAPFTYLAP